MRSKGNLFSLQAGYYLGYYFWWWWGSLHITLKYHTVLAGTRYQFKQTAGLTKDGRSYSCVFLDPHCLVEMNPLAPASILLMHDTSVYGYITWLRHVPPCQALSYFSFSYFLMNFKSLLFWFGSVDIVLIRKALLAKNSLSKPSCFDRIRK